MMQGNPIIDIGALYPRGPGALPSSNYYDMEQAQVAGYAGYSQDPQLAWDLRS